MAAMVVQFGLAIIRPSGPGDDGGAAAGLTSETTNGMAGSFRHAEELSITIAPASANLGASAFDRVAPAENKAMSIPEGSALEASSTTIWPEAPGQRRPADRAEAKNRIADTGNSAPPACRRITPPT